MSTPVELTSAPRWLCWRLEPDPKGGKPRKVPYDPKTCRRASSTNPETWATMAEAQAAKDRYLFAGIGYVFVEESGVVGVDIDHCMDEQGRLNDMAAERGQKLSQMAVAWLLHNKAVATVLVGASRPEQIEDNVRAVENLSFSDEELERIEKILGKEN